MNFKSFDELLYMDVACTAAVAGDAALFIIGDQADTLAHQLQTAGATVRPLQARVLLGLPILTAPFPLFVGGLMTERNTPLSQMSLFGWIEDNYIGQPRAEVFGLTPFAEQPVLFIRDFDMDRPVEPWYQTLQPAHWVRVAGVVAATERAGDLLQVLKGDEAALVAMEHALPADVQALVTAMRVEVARGQSLRAVLRQLRKSADAKVMRVLDGWRVLAQAAQIARLNPIATPNANLADALKLAPPKRW